MTTKTSHEVFFVNGVILLQVKALHKDNWESERDRKQADCKHRQYVTKCSHCGLVLCSEHTEEKVPPVEIMIAD